MQITSNIFFVIHELTRTLLYLGLHVIFGVCHWLFNLSGLNSSPSGSDSDAQLTELIALLLVFAQTEGEESEKRKIQNAHDSY